MDIKELREAILEMYKDTLPSENGNMFVIYNKRDKKIFTKWKYDWNDDDDNFIIAETTAKNNPEFSELDFLQTPLYKEIENIINKNDKYLEFPYPEKIKNSIIEMWNNDKNFYDDIKEFTELSNVYTDSGMDEYILEEYMRELIDIFSTQALPYIMETAKKAISAIDNGEPYSIININDDNFYR